MVSAPKCKVCGQTHWGTCYTRPPSGGRREKALAGEVPGVNERPARGGKLVQVQQPPPANRRAAIKPKLDAAISKLAPPAVLDEAPAITPAKRRGRPATGFDKKAYDRDKAKARRAAKKGTTK